MKRIYTLSLSFWIFNSKSNEQSFIDIVTRSCCRHCCTQLNDIRLETQLRWLLDSKCWIVPHDWYGKLNLYLKTPSCNSWTHNRDCKNLFDFARVSARSKNHSLDFIRNHATHNSYSQRSIFIWSHRPRPFPRLPAWTWNILICIYF